MTDLAPWLNPTIVSVAYTWAGIAVAIGVAILIHSVRVMVCDWPDTTSPEEDAAQMAYLVQARKRQNVTTFTHRPIVVKQ